MCTIHIQRKNTWPWPLHRLQRTPLGYTLAVSRFTMLTLPSQNTVLVEQICYTIGSRPYRAAPREHSQKCPVSSRWHGTALITRILGYHAGGPCAQTRLPRQEQTAYRHTMTMMMVDVALRGTARVRCPVLPHASERPNASVQQKNAADYDR